MSKLITIHDFSPSRAQTGALLNASSDLMEKNGIIQGPYNSLLYEIVPTHTSLWTVRTDKLPFPEGIKKQWDEIATCLDSGKDVLLHTFAIAEAAHDFFHKQFIERIDTSRHSVKSLIIIGSPVILLEQYFRSNGLSAPNADTQGYISRLLNLPSVIRKLRENYGAEAVTLLPNLTQNIATAPDPQLSRQIMAWLGLNCPDTLPRSIANPAFGSSLSIRLRSAMEVRDNAWPYINPGIIENALYKTDASLPLDVRSPLELRQKFAEESVACIRELEALANLEDGSLNAPEYLLQKEQTLLPTSIPEDVIADFCSNLGAEATKILQQRLQNDITILNNNQKSVLDYLKDKPEFSQIGEVQPPIELTVLTMTYNHEKYIAQCMDSVLAQKTDFPVQHIVLDHHSEDGTAAIVAEYAKRHSSIRPVLLSHRRINENVYGLFARCRTKYAALCDGDDYFLNPDKLQKQVDFLEKNPDYSLCFHPVLAVFEDGKKPVIFPPLDTLPERKNGGIYIADLIRTNFIQTNSAVYRWRFTDGLPEWFRSDLCPGDWYWHLLHAEVGRIGFIPEIMSAYRRHAGALYAEAQKSQLNHRRRLGMAELGTYQACDEHFKFRFHKPLSTLATGVFSDFVKLMMDEDEPRLLNWAVEKYPVFARDFLRSLSALEAKEKREQTGE